MFLSNRLITTCPVIEIMSDLYYTITVINKQIVTKNHRIVRASLQERRPIYNNL